MTYTRRTSPIVGGVVLALGLTLAAAAAPAAHAQSFSVVKSFTGPGLNDSGFIPPDTMGAAGLNGQFAVTLNGRVTYYDTTSGGLSSAAQIGTQTGSQFWTNAGVSLVSGEGVVDPRILFDAASQRWFVSSITDFGGVGTPNRLLLGVSNTASLLDGFRGYAIDANPAGQSPGGLFLDYDMLGVNGDGVFVGGLNFTSAGSNASPSILAASKTALVSNTFSASSYKLFYDTSINAIGPLPHPVTDLDPVQGTAKEFFLSEYNTSAGVAALSSVNGSLSNPAGLTLNGSGPNVTVSSSGQYASPVDGVQKGTTTKYDGGDDRFSGAVIKKNGYLWGIQGVKDNTTGRDALHWEQIDPTTGVLVADGLIGDANHDYTYGSIAVNDFGDVVIGYSRSGADEYVSAYASVGHVNVGGVGITFGSPTLVQAGQSPYTVDFGSGTVRWGDYSSTMVDPGDPLTFWTVQEFAGPGGTGGSGSGTWSVQVAALRIAASTTAAPEPSALALLALGGLPGVGLMAAARKRRRHA